MDYLTMNQILKLLLLCLVLPLAGCNIMAYPAYVILGEHEIKVNAQYKGLEGKHTAIMISGHPGLAFEYPYIMSNLALASQKMISANVELCSFVNQNEIESFQRMNPQWIGLHMQQLGKQFDAQRIIYVEIVQLSMREEQSVNLLRGHLITDIKVYDLESGNQEEAVLETEVEAIFPERAPEFMSDSAEHRIKEKLVMLFADKLSKKFYDHKIPRN